MSDGKEIPKIGYSEPVKAKHLDLPKVSPTNPKDVAKIDRPKDPEPLRAEIELSFMEKIV